MHLRSNQQTLSYSDRLEAAGEDQPSAKARRSGVRHRKLFAALLVPRRSDKRYVLAPGHRQSDRASRATTSFELRKVP